jgi:hypothetical protein
MSELKGITDEDITVAMGHIVEFCKTSGRMGVSKLIARDGNILLFETKKQKLIKNHIEQFEYLKVVA